MAKYDLYLRLDDPSSGADPAWFAVNFLKGAAGLWMQLLLFVGTATALSTYFSNVITLLVTAWLYVHGLAREFVLSVIQGKNVGGGPMQSLLALVGRQVGSGPMPPAPKPVLQNAWFTLNQYDTSGLSETPWGHASVYFDPLYRWFLARVFDLYPDIERFNLTPLVAEGFDVGLGQLLATLLLVVGYVVPWAVLAYYLLKWREIASAA
jgi:hypothetical protein